MQIKTPFCDTFSESIKKEETLLFEGLWDSPKALLLSMARKTLAKPLIVVTSGEREGRLYEDLLFFQPENLFELPAWEALPGEEVRPSVDVMGRRLEILHNLLHAKKPSIVLTPLQSLLLRTPSPKSLEKNFLELKVGETIAFEELIEWIRLLGYQKTKLVTDKGFFAVRGGIIDIYPTSAYSPFRIEFFGNKIDNIRSFEPLSQKSIEKKSSLLLSPGNEEALLKEEKEPATLLDYLPDSVLVFDDLLKLEDRYAALKSLEGAKSRFFVPLEEFLEKKNKKIFFTEKSVEELSETSTPKRGGRDFYTGKTPYEPIFFDMFHHKIETKRHYHPFQMLHEFFDAEDLCAGVGAQHANTSLQVLFLFENEKEEEHLKEAFSLIPKHSSFEKGYLSTGFAMGDLPLAVIPYTELSNRKKIRRTKWRTSYHTPLVEYHALEFGDLVVHFHHGVGRYLGLEKEKNHLGIESEFLILEYANQSKLFVPVSQSHLVSRYIGIQEDKPELHQIGSSKWQKIKETTQKAILGYAKEMLTRLAEREIAGGFAFAPDGAETLAFRDSFPYTETADQERAIADIRSDMCSNKSMDRLIAGDVGYGKTEVCMRAAFKAVADGKKQVAVLVPTTILAMQHYETFCERFALFPINIALLSRFQTKKEGDEVLKKVKSGAVDILIGTHRILGGDVAFHDLGLIIIDEEQRFGVRAKEKLKLFKTGVDSLSLSATPIPRTLYMSLIGARPMSVINSPPHDRLPIKTILAEKEDEVIKNALARELARDGQAYFIHNRVESIYGVAEHLQKLVPHARIAVAHGQMDADSIEEVFHAFKQGQVDILVATTLVENGVDIPNANTILIDRADTFGISDLYQLRGRVGRWNKTAYTYFLIPKGRVLPEVAQKRLNALIENSGFGGGIRLAMRDLEIRGAGDILGVQQSGHVSKIGFHLYCKLLKRTIDALRKEETASFFETKLECPFIAKFPDYYISDSAQRLEIYHRIGEASSYEEIDEIFEELKDRFGPLPDPALFLYHLTRIRLFANKHHFTSLKFLPNSLIAERGPHKHSFLLPPNFTPKQLEEFVIARLMPPSPAKALK